MSRSAQKLSMHHPLSRLSKQGIIEFLLTLVFIASFAPYVVGITTGTLLIAPALLLIAAAFVLLFLYPTRCRESIRSLFSPRLIVFAYVFPVISCVISVGNGEWSSVSYSALMIIVLTACQIMLSVVSINRLLLSFTRSGIVAVAAFSISDWHEILHSATTSTRLIPSQTHPNTIGFIFAGYIGLFLWRILDRQLNLASRGLYFALICAASGTIFLAQSRASMLAVVCAFTWVALLAIGRASRGKKVYMRFTIAMFMTVISGGIITIAAKPSYINQGTAYLADVLHIDTRYRGVNSDLSGRIPRWEAAIAALPEDGRWAIGSGYRSSKKGLGFSIDNGYLTIWYEGGFFLLLLTVGQLLWCVWIASKRYTKEPDNERRWLFATFGSVIIILMVNNIFDRYLLGIGNPFSLLGLFILLTRRHDLDFAIRNRRILRSLQIGGAKQAVETVTNGNTFTYS